MALTEHTLNDALGTLLLGMRRRWLVRSEELRTVQGSARRPDLLITEDGALPLVIEHEIMPAVAVEDEARGRLGLRLRDSGKPVQVVIALRSPRSIAEGEGGAELRQRWLKCDSLEYVLFRKLPREDITRWPMRGWLRGSVRDLALLAQQASRPGEEIDALADIFERQIERAEKLFTDTWPEDDARAATMLSEHLRLEDGLQTRHMAMAILANALIFQQALAPQLNDMPPELANDIKTPTQLFIANRLDQVRVLRAWHAILTKNYYPIFWVASNILEWMNRADTARDILYLLYQVIERLHHGGAVRSHDLTGFVFQRLIADRKFLATYYTRPESAALLAALALPQARPLAGSDWGDAKSLSSLQIGDFACGTGTLLSAAYQRLGALHELQDGNAATLHKYMLQQSLVGCDVLPMAVHLTLSMLASAYPEISFEHCRMLSMPYGRQERKLGKRGEFDYALGSLDLLDTQIVLPTLATRPTAVGGTGEALAHERHVVNDNSFDLVIMNPPFSRAGGQEGRKIGISVPAFAGLQNTRQEQQAMSKILSGMSSNFCYDGKAGLASAFISMAHKKLHEAGTLAFVLPVTMVQGESWRKVRKAISSFYRDVFVLSIAAGKTTERSFSADTGMGECLVVATKAEEKSDHGRATFVCLEERPRQYEGEVLAKLIQENRKDGLRTIEETAPSNTSLLVGNQIVGKIIDAPIGEGPWHVEGISDMAVVQCAYHLALGHLLLPGWPSGTSLPMTIVNTLATVGPYHQQIYRTDGKGAFEKEDTYSDTDYYPMLWTHVAERERCFIVLPDCHGIPNDHDRAVKLASTATHVHHNRDFRFNSQSLAACWTERQSLGGHAWPTIRFHRDEYGPVYMLWANSTLGCLCYWWQATKQHSGRGRIPKSAIINIPTLDLQALSEEQLAAAGRIFEDMKHCPMLPVNQIDEDPVRAELDRRLLTEVLNLPEELCAMDGPMDLLRRKLAAEPSIHGGKKSKVTIDVPKGCLPD